MAANQKSMTFMEAYAKSDDRQNKEEKSKALDEEELFFGPKGTPGPPGIQSIKEWPWKKPDAVRQRLQQWAHGEPPEEGWQYRLIRVEREYKYGNNGEGGLPRKVVYQDTKTQETAMLVDYYEIAKFMEDNLFGKKQ